LIAEAYEVPFSDLELYSWADRLGGMEPPLPLGSGDGTVLPSGLGRTRGKVAVTEVLEHVRGAPGSARVRDEPFTRGWRAAFSLGVSAVDVPGTVPVLHVVGVVMAGAG
jgi:hypothetical protein